MKSNRSLRWFAAASGFVFFLQGSSHAEPLPGTAPLEETGDLAAGMVDGIHVWLDREGAAAVAARQARALVEGFLAELPEERRLVFFLSEVEGWSAPEVAAALELNLNTVYSRLRRARAAFEPFLRRHGGRS